MDFALFLLVNAILFIRPAEVIPVLNDFPFYEAAIVACAAVSLPRLVRQLTPSALAGSPITVCVLAMLPAVVLSHVARLQYGLAAEQGVPFAKVVFYYLLFVAVVNTRQRLYRFLGALVVFIAVLAGLALFQFHGIIDIPALATLEQNEIDPRTGDLISIIRLQSTGIYNDPNDLSLILGVGILVSLWLCSRKDAGLTRLAWAAPIPLFAYAVVLTQSRGGFLALMAGLLVLFHARYGWKKALALAGVALPVAVVLFAGRQTSLSMGEGTSQERIQIWSEGLDLFRSSPVFGIGAGKFADEVGLVAHNSFLHCFAELGVVGGLLFLGAFVCALRSAWALRRAAGPAGRGAPDVVPPFALALTVAYAVGLLSLSRPYVASTYAVLGLVAASVRVAGGPATRPVLPVSFRLGRSIALAGGTYLACLYLFVRVFVNRG
jgi:hypothetical protein